MPLVACTDPTFSYRGGISTATAPGATQHALNPAGLAPPFGVDFLFSIANDSLCTMLSSFRAELWILSGVGTVFTEELLVASVVASTLTASASLSQATILPIANRRWNYTTDGFRLKQNGQVSGVSSAARFIINGQVCFGTGGGDCCAELNLKLDQVIQAVSKSYIFPP